MLQENFSGDLRALVKGRAALFDALDEQVQGVGAG